MVLVEKNGNTIDVTPQGENSITLATADTYVDKNIVFNIHTNSGSGPNIPSYDDSELRGLVSDHTASISKLENNVASNAAAIGENASGISNNTSRIAANENAIAQHIAGVNEEISRLDGRIDTKQDILTAGKDIKIEDNVISVATEWNITEFDSNAMKTGKITAAAPNGYIFDKIYILCYWYGSSAVATTIYGGFYNTTDTTALNQVLRNNGTNKMGAGWITAEVNNLNNVAAICFGEAYLYNNNGSETSLSNPVNSYGIGRYSTTNNFKYFTIHNFPSGLTNGYCCLKYILKKEA